MNLIDLISRKDKNLHLEGIISVSRVVWHGETWRTVETSEGNHVIAFRDFQRTYMFRSRNVDLGWYVCALGKSGIARVALVSDDEIICESAAVLNEYPMPLRLHWPVGKRLADRVELRLEIEGAARVYVHRALKREPLYQLTRGKGVEIGPGPRPKIFPSEDIEVQYLEELPQEEWFKYDKTGKYGTADADWSRYIIGKACNVPVEDESLDFIFSSHVFEHLANPLGHLAHWYSKLKGGGSVIAIVPDLVGCKDYAAKPSDLKALIEEKKTGVWEPVRRHYERFARYRNRPSVTDEYMEDKRSIHVHFYTCSNVPEILNYAITDIGYKSYDYIYEKNHKDFHLVLYK